MGPEVTLEVNDAFTGEENWISKVAFAMP